MAFRPHGPGVGQGRCRRSQDVAPVGQLNGLAGLRHHENEQATHRPLLVEVGIIVVDELPVVREKLDQWVVAVVLIVSRINDVDVVQVEALRPIAELDTDATSFAPSTGSISVFSGSLGLEDETGCPFEPLRVYQGNVPTCVGNVGVCVLRIGFCLRRSPHPRASAAPRATMRFDSSRWTSLLRPGRLPKNANYRQARACRSPQS